MAKQRVALNTVSSQTHSYAFCARCDFGVFSGGKTRKRAVDTHGSRDFLFRALIPSSRRRGPQVWVVRGGTERSPLSSPLQRKITYGQPRAEVLRYRDTRAGHGHRRGAHVCVFGPILHAISRWKAVPAGWRGF